MAVPGFRNLRDVGGYPLLGGGTTAPGRLLRGDFPAPASAETLDGLRRVPIGLVIDLRGDEETTADPSPFPGWGIAVHAEPLFEGSASSFVAQRFSIEQMYAHLVQHSGAALARVARAVATTDTVGATLVHCTAGKDRTGIAVALILSAIGVDRRHVVADYADTERHYDQAWRRERIAALQQHHVVDLTDVIDLLATSPAPAMAAVLDRIDARWGSPEGYLRAHGLRDEELGGLRDRLT